MHLLIAVFFTSLLAAQPASRPAGAAMPKDPNLPTVWLIGDSTVRVGTKGQVGWGDPIEAMFDTSKINVVNRAMGGRSSRTFITEGRWDSVLADSKPGDYVIMQFGHNDAGPLSGDNRERGSIKGIGEETQEVTLVLKNNQKETVHTYGWYMRKYVRDAKAKGLRPIVCTPIPRCPRPAENQPPRPIEAYKGPESYGAWAIEVARAEGVPHIDLYERIWTGWQGKTPAEIKAAYFGEADFTHTTEAGATFNAGKVVEGIRALQDSDLKQYLK
jgi:lysophospholipase L1-like esterase